MEIKRCLGVISLPLNLVLTSSMPLFRHWAGHDFYLPGPAGNDISRTNVPTSRIKHRHETLVQELEAILMTNLKEPQEDAPEDADETLTQGPAVVTRRPSASGLKSEVYVTLLPFQIGL